MQDSLQLFTEDDCRRLAEHPWLQGVELYAQLDSTNRRALECCEQTAAPHLVVAETQTAGRGRLGSRWWSELGGLMFSLTIDAAQYRLTRQRLPLMSLVTGWAVRQALIEVVPRERVRLKWPNDVYVDDRKICGVLLEASDARPLHVVVGVGLNIENDLSQAPEEIRRRATTLAEHSDPPPSTGEMLEMVLDQLRRCLEQLAAGQLRLAERWSSACMLHGRSIKVELPDGELAGTGEGIDQCGALQVRVGAELKSVVAGAVVEVDGRRLTPR